MTDLNKMWQELEQYQFHAERQGFGDAWLRMTTKRTKEAAQNAAYWAATRAAGKLLTANLAARAAFSAAMARSLIDFVEGMAGWHVADADEWTEKGVKWSQIAIENIRDAIEKEDKT